MSDQTEGSYQDELQLLILEKQADDNTYIYNCHRPVEGTQGNFTVKVPNSLDGKELKFLLFSNSKDIIGDPDQKFVVTDGTNKNEDDIRAALLLTVNTKWEPSKKSLCGLRTLSPSGLPRPALRPLLLPPLN